MTSGEAGHVEFGALKNKLPKIQGRGVGLATSPLLFLLFCSSLFWGKKFARGWRVLVFNAGAFINLFGPPPFVFIPRAFTNPMWTL